MTEQLHSEKWYRDENLDILESIMKLMPYKTPLRLLGQHEEEFMKFYFSPPRWLECIDRGSAWHGERLTTLDVYAYDAGMHDLQFLVVYYHTMDGRWGFIEVPKVNRPETETVLNQFYEAFKSDGMVQSVLNLLHHAMKGYKRKRKGTSGSS